VTGPMMHYTYSFGALKMKTIGSEYMLITIYQNARRHTPEDSNFECKDSATNLACSVRFACLIFQKPARLEGR
jgi:hypothetical protein